MLALTATLVFRKPAQKYCLRECGDEFFTRHNHGRLRAKLIKQSKWVCNLCFRKYRQAELILDHRIPIALGGPEFDGTNLQIICIACNREKTREDRCAIEQARRRERAAQGAAERESSVQERKTRRLRVVRGINNCDAPTEIVGRTAERFRVARRTVAGAKVNERLVLGQHRLSGFNV